MKHVLVPYTFKLDEDLKIGGKSSPEFTTHIDKKFMNKIVGQCVGQSIYISKNNAKILFGEKEGEFEPNSYNNDPETQQAIATVASYTYKGLWLDLPDSLIDTIKDLNIKVTFRWTCVSDTNAMYVDSISNVSLAYEPEDKSNIDSGCKYFIL